MTRKDEPPPAPAPQPTPEEVSALAAYFAGFDAGYAKGLRAGARAGGVPPKAFGPIRAPAACDLFPVMAATEPDRLVTLFALCRVEHQANRRNGAPLGELAP
jgi:hypothetical protein